MKLLAEVWLWWAISLRFRMVLVSSQEQNYDPPVSFLVDCGSQNNSTIDGRQWMSDSSSSRFLSSSSQILASLETNVSSPISPLLTTARFFNHSSSYTFHLSSAVFSIKAGHYTLLENISVVGLIASGFSNNGYLFKEFSIVVTDPVLAVNFIPSPTNGSYAFVNALEVVSVPSGLISDNALSLGDSTPSPIDLAHMALETMYRVNVGGPLVAPLNDTAGLYRTWLPDKSFVYAPAEVENISTSVTSIRYRGSISNIFAPRIVYSTALQTISPRTANPQSINISWVFPVVANYLYVIRLHFCDFVNNAGGKRIFNVYLQNETASSNLDLARMLDGEDVAYFVDYSLYVQKDIHELWVQAGPPPNAAVGIFNKAILNGIEIWKLNNSQGSLDALAGGLPESNPGSKIRFAIIIGALVGGVVAASVLFVVTCLRFRQRPKSTNQLTPTWVPLPVHAVVSASKAPIVSQERISHVLSAPFVSGRRFTFAEILGSTKNFDESLVVGVGGFGKVYLGLLEGGTKVAVKRGNAKSEQGIAEFHAEIRMLSKLRHRHLVSLIGYCEERREMILVYEYMANGPLRRHLYGSDLPALSWRHRLEICIGAARGLHYLHTGADRGIIHRDVKTTNILLDENFVAKISDFGLSKTRPLEQTHVTTAVKGSFGYLDPEYFRSQQLTQKSDIYSFGVVLMEVLCGRPAINPALPRDQVNIVEWALHWQRRGMLDQVVDPRLAGTINITSLAKFGETSEKCLTDEGINRPSIGEVLWNLEYALQLHVAAVDNVNEGSSNQISELTLPAQEQREERTEEDQV